MLEEKKYKFLKEVYFLSLLFFREMKTKSTMNKLLCVIYIRDNIFVNLWLNSTMVSLMQRTNSLHQRLSTDYIHPICGLTVTDVEFSPGGNLSVARKSVQIWVHPACVFYVIDVEFSVRSSFILAKRNSFYKPSENSEIHFTSRNL